MSICLSVCVSCFVFLLRAVTANVLDLLSSEELGRGVCSIPFRTRSQSLHGIQPARAGAAMGPPSHVEVTLGSVEQQFKCGTWVAGRFRWATPSTG